MEDYDPEIEYAEWDEDTETFTQETDHQMQRAIYNRLAGLL